MQFATHTGFRWEHIPGAVFEVPGDFALPKCDHCGEVYLRPDDIGPLDEAIRPQVLAWQEAHVGELVDRLRSHHSVDQSTVERVCGVTPTYLSHILHGR